MTENKIETPEYVLHNGDCVTVMKTLPDASADLIIYSPPFSSLFSYSSHLEDMGNSRESDDEFLLHYEFCVPELFRLLKPGRNLCLHIADVPRLKEQHGFIGAHDLMGDLIRIHERYGFIFYRRWTVNKNPQAQSILRHSVTLTFTQFEKDSLMSAAALPDYIVVFKKMGDSPPVLVEAMRDEWIEWANPTWYGHHETIQCPQCRLIIRKGISQTDTLNTTAARSADDERHICPLQLPLIDRLVRLYSNKGETIFTPFAGIGSEVVGALKRKRRGVGVELKREYFEQAAKNCAQTLIDRDAQGVLL